MLLSIDSIKIVCTYSSHADLSIHRISRFELQIIIFLFNLLILNNNQIINNALTDVVLN